MKSFRLLCSIPVALVALSLSARAATTPFEEDFDELTLGDTAVPGFVESSTGQWTIVGGTGEAGDHDYQNDLTPLSGGRPSSSLADFSGTLGGTEHVSFTLSATFVLTSASASPTSTLGFAALSTSTVATSTTNYYLADVTQAGTIRLVQIIDGAVSTINGFTADPVANLAGGLVVGHEYTFTLTGTYTGGNAIDLDFTVQDLTTPALSASASASATTALTGTNFGIRNRQQGSSGANFTSTIDDVEVNVNPVPEPSTAMLLGLSAGLFGALRRRRK